MIDLSNRNIFVYDSDNNGSSVISSLINFMQLDGKNFATVSNRSISSLQLTGIHRAKFESTAVDDDRKFENVVNDNIFRLDYLLLDVHPPDRYFDNIDFIDIPVIFLCETNDGMATFHTSRVPKEYKIYFMYKNRVEKNPNSTSYLDRYKYIYYMKDIRSDKVYNLESVYESYKRHKKIDDILSKD